MEKFRDLITIERSADVPIYLQLANAIIHQILSGRLRKGRKMPGSRSLADLLNINRMTVVAAYEELKAQGWIIQHARKGSFINDQLPILQPKEITENTSPFLKPPGLPFPVNEDRVGIPILITGKPGQLVIDDGFPDLRLAPVREIARSMKGLSRMPTYTRYLQYATPKGNGLLRKVLSGYLNDTRGLPVNEDNLMITRGATMGIYLASRIITQPGDHVIMSEPGFRFARRIFNQLELNINKVRVDEYGMDIDAVEQICKTRPIRLVYTVPHHHYPTTVTLSPERRIRLLELARKYSFAIIEDDYDYDFHYSSKPMMPMASIDRYGNVVYVGTLTKTLAPSIRIGFLTANENFINRAASYRNLIDFQGDTFSEAVIAELFRDGTMTRHIKKALKTYKERRDHFCNLLKDQLGEKVSFGVPDGGMCVWTKFNDVDLKKLSLNAGLKGLEISDGSKYNTTGNDYNSIRMGFASLSFHEQEKAISILKSCL